MRGLDPELVGNPGSGHDREAVRARAVANLAKVRLSDKEGHYPGELSRGKQKRVVG